MMASFVCVCANDLVYFVLIFVKLLLFIFIFFCYEYNIAGGEYTDTHQAR